jgi:SAM-dependent methyltransferase
MERSGPAGDRARLLADQIRYYDDRAPEYEDLWYRRGRHDLGPEFNARWFEETAIVEAAVDAAASDGSVLEIGCGSGLWTRRLAPHASRYVALDSSPAMLELNRDHTRIATVEYVLADTFEWSSDDRFDLVFLGFFVSHVPPELFQSWWQRIGSWLRPHGLVYLVDDATGPHRPYSGDTVHGSPAYAHRRRLSGEREYTIVKLFYSPEELADLLSQSGWIPEIRSSGRHFLYGSVRPGTGPGSVEA